ncbi:MAG: hypothetical protein Q7U47_10530 [Paludibacter sp.]|nr:hypothetical protein [Paludibacter sp.]
MKENKHLSLDKIGNKIPFTVPDNYFDEFALQMESQTDVVAVPVKKLLKPWMYMAAMFIGILLLSNVAYTVYNGNINKNKENYEMYVYSQLDESVIFDYYLNDSNAK